MKRRVSFLIAGLMFFALTYLAIYITVRPRYFADGRILLRLNYEALANQPPFTNWYDWFYGQSSAISNLWIQNKTILAPDSANGAASTFLVGVYPVRGTHLFLIRFGGGEKDAVWCAASNTCMMLTGFYATNRSYAYQTTNLITWDTEYIGTEFYIPETLWRRMLDEVESLFQRLRN